MTLLKKILFSLLVTILLTSTLEALPIYGNQSHLRWKTVSSEHFIFNYPSEYTEHAGIVAAYAEAVYDSIVKRYRTDLHKKVNVNLHDALYANGNAIPTENTINLWLTNWDFKLRSSHHWLSDVITHEFSHLVSIENGSKLPPFVYGFQVSYSDYYNENTTSNFLSMFPFTLQPLWLAEGTAQFESARMGFDGWDSHRDMLLRTAALEEDLLSLEFMHSFANNALKAELGPYTQGFSLIRYIASHYGEETISKIWSEMSRIHRVTVDAAIQSVLGISEKELYEAWKREITEQYEKQKESLGLLVMGEKWTTDAFYQDFLVVAGNSLYGISNFGGDWFDGSLFKMPKTRDSLTDEQSKKDSLVILDFEGTIDIKDYSKSGFKPKKAWFERGFSIRESKDKGPLLAYVHYKNKDRNGRTYFDLDLLDTNGKVEHITSFADAVYPDISPNVNEIVFARRLPNSSRFALSLAPISKEDDSYDEEYVDIFIPEDSLFYYNIYSPKFSPDGKKITFSFFDNTTRGIAVIDRDGKNLKLFSSKNIDSRDPNWIDSERIIYSHDGNGIFNLYELNLATGKTTPLTNVLDGAFTPVVDSSTIFYTGYDKDGFSIYSLKLDEPTQDTTIQKKPLELKGIKPQKNNKEIELLDITLHGVETNYKPIPTIPLLVPLISFEERAPDFTVAGDGEVVPKIGLIMLLSDPLKKNLLQVGGLIEISKDFDYFNSSGLNPSYGRDFFALLENRSFPITLQLNYMHSNYVNKDTVRYEDPRSYEDSISTSHYAVPVHSFMGGLGYSLFKKNDSLTISLGYDWADFNLYEDDLRWTYHKRVNAGVSLSHYSGFSEDNSNAISGEGNGISLSYQYSNADLYRPGTFAESFTVSASGAIKPIYRNFQIHELGLSLFGSLDNPIHSGARFAAGANVSGILSWKSKNKSDTLDAFYYHPLFLEGYPYLISTEDFARSGTKTALAQLHYIFPIYKDFRKHLWIFTSRDFFIDVFAQVGTAWNSSWFDKEALKNIDLWDRSVGFEIRLANTLFYSIPLDISLSFARGLDRIAKKADGSGGSRLHRIDIPLLPTAIEPTKISFTIGMGFNNRWMK